MSHDQAQDARKITSWQSAASGAIAGVLCRLAIAPLDVVKIRFQMQTAPKPLLRSTSKLLTPTATATPQKYRTILQSLSVIAKEEGLRGLWKGNWPAEYLYLLYGSVQFFVYDDLRQTLIANHVPTPTFLAGGLAGSAATIATYPLDLLRTRFAMQGNVKVYGSLVGACREVAKTEGLSGFYRGVWPSILQIGPYMGIMFSVQNWMNDALAKVEHPLWTHEINQFLAGGFAGIVSKTAVMPFDVVRKRLQVQGPHRNSYIQSGIPRLSGGFIKCARQIVEHEGVLALYKGLWVSLIKTAPSSAITFWVVAQYEFGSERNGTGNERRDDNATPAER
ncbi:mitochondrial thiamine pyrophosphate transporter [Podochytrium sp. JEL0797]|nr:mitochondrial thiamine pyrophosphate transporter [Podochytrium sp. JEL0797]